MTTGGGNPRSVTHPVNSPPSIVYIVYAGAVGRDRWGIVSVLERVLPGFSGSFVCLSLCVHMSASKREKFRFSFFNISRHFGASEHNL